MFRAALTSRSCRAPHSQHVHSLIRRPALPLGLLAGIAPQHEQVRLELCSETTSHRIPACSLLYLSIPRSMVQPLSYTDLARFVLPTADGLTSPITISALLSTVRRDHLCSASRRWFFTFAWSARTRCFLPARAAQPTAACAEDDTRRARRDLIDVVRSDLPTRGNEGARLVERDAGSYRHAGRDGNSRCAAGRCVGRMPGHTDGGARPDGDAVFEVAVDDTVHLHVAALADDRVAADNGAPLDGGARGEMNARVNPDIRAYGNRVVDLDIRIDDRTGVNAGTGRNAGSFPVGALKRVDQRAAGFLGGRRRNGEPIDLALPELVWCGAFRHPGAGRRGGVGTDPAAIAARGIGTVEQDVGVALVETEKLTADGREAVRPTGGTQFLGHGTGRGREEGNGNRRNAGDPTVGARADPEIEGYGNRAGENESDTSGIVAGESLVLVLDGLVVAAGRRLQRLGRIDAGHNVGGELRALHVADVVCNGFQPGWNRHERSLPPRRATSRKRRRRGSTAARLPTGPYLAWRHEKPAMRRQTPCPKHARKPNHVHGMHSGDVVRIRTR